MRVIRAIGAPIAVLLAVALSQHAPAYSAPARCDDILPVRHHAPPGTRPLTAMDLARLRDIEPSGRVLADAGAIALSPDRTMVAFQLRRANPSENDYCLAMVILPLRHQGIPHIIDRGGEFLRDTFDFRGKASFPTGNARSVLPRWAPNGKWVAFLKRVAGKTQVWRAAPQETAGSQLTISPVDVDDFRISQDGTTLIFTTKPALAEALDQIEKEGRSGFHFDDRYSPMSSSRPFATAPIKLVYWRQEIASGAVRPATPDEASLFNATPGRSPDQRNYVRSARGRAAWIIADPFHKEKIQLLAELPAKTIVSCRHDACRERIERVWWARNGREIRFMRREGWAREATAIYQWTPGRARSKRLFVTNDLLADCVPEADELICLHENPTQPIQIARVAFEAGRIATLYNPNPEFDTFTLGRVERLRWRNDYGLEVYGDVVLPVGYDSQRRYPLIIVQYTSRGFLRGGTGDEYPIHVFANKGYVVLSVNRPIAIGRARGQTEGVAIERQNLQALAERRSLLSAIEVGVTQLVRSGVVDENRIGITGLSDGSTTVQFALANGRKFAAASTSSGFWDPGYAQLVGPSAAREFAAAGYPRATEYQSDFWHPFSIARNATSITTPILLQLADDEYLTSLEGFSMLRELGGPADMYIFPGEHHIKWQPAHRLAIYERNLDWFDFWLCAPSAGPDRADGRFKLWAMLRAEASGSTH